MSYTTTASTENSSTQFSKTTMTNISIVFSINDCSCNNWLGFARKGSLRAKQLSTYTSIAETYEQACLLGIQETLPLMIANSQVKKPFCLFFEEFPQNNTFVDEEWLKNFSKHCQISTKDNIGVYITPQFNHLNTTEHTTLERILYFMIKENKTTDYYVLLGEHRSNDILNQLLNLKRLLLAENIKTSINH
jgi:hypothetical protein